MSAFLHEDVIARVHVTNPRAFSTYSHQMLGTKKVTPKEFPGFVAQIGRFFKERPRATWATLVRTIDYMRAKRRRVCYPTAVLKFVNMAYTDGFLPELDVTSCERDDDLEVLINKALTVETNPGWRRMLEGCRGDRHGLYNEWLQRRELLGV